MFYSIFSRASNVFLPNDEEGAYRVLKLFYLKLPIEQDLLSHR